MEIVIIFIVLGVLIWLALKLRRNMTSSVDSVLSEAWRTVLSDPNYQQRRPLEERKHAAEIQAETLAKAAKESSETS